MKKNVSGQFVGAMLIAKADGTPVTSGTTTVSYVGDNGSYTTGSVGSGAATHKGGGYWEYAPSQGETNFDHVAFVFVNTNAVNAAIQIFTSFPQTGDNFARLGAPAGASVSADVAAVKGVLPSALVSGRMDASVGAMASGVLTATAIAADAITAAKIADGAIDAATFAAGAIDATAIATDAFGALELAAGAASEIATAVRTELTTELGRIDVATSTRASQTSVDTIDDFVDTEVAAIKAKTDQLTFSTSNRVDAQVFGMEAGTVTAAAIATDAIDADAIKTDAVTEIQSGLSTLTAAGVRTAVGLSSANLDTQLGTLATASALSTVAGYVDTEVAAIKTVTDKVSTALESDGGAGYQFTTTALENAPSGSGASAADIADAVWDEAIADHQNSGSTGESLNGAGAGGNPWLAVLEGSFTAGDLLRVIAAVQAGKTSIVKTGSGTATVTFRDITDASDIVEATMAGSERTAITVTP